MRPAFADVLEDSAAGFEPVVHHCELDRFSDWLKLEPGIAQASYDIYVKGMSLNGVVPDRVLETDIERARKEQQVKEAVPLERVVDFGPLRESLTDLGTR